MDGSIGPTPARRRGDSAARRKLVEAAARLFCRFGINAIGVDTIVAEAGAAKATLYKIFGSKEKLVEAVLEEQGRCWREWFLAGLDAGQARPAERLRRIFPLLETWFRQDRFYGCPFINAIGEHDKTEARLREITLAHKKAVLAHIETLATEAGAENPARLAHQLGLLMDGAIVVALISKDPGAAGLAAGAAEKLIAECRDELPA